MRLRVLITLMAAVFSSTVGVVALGQTVASAHDHDKSCYSTCPTSTSLTASSHEVTYGSEQLEVFTVTVTPRTPGVPGVPSGTVTIKWGWTTLCTITLSGGTGSCALSPTQLKATHRPYLAFAFYGGDSSFYRSWSHLVNFKVDPVPTTTTTTTIPSRPPHHHHDGFNWPFDF